MPHVGTCGGEEFAAFTGCATLSSYLVLFIFFYAATYKKASQKDKRSTKAISTSIPKTAAIDLKNVKMPTVQETTESATEAFTTIAQDLHLTSSGRK